jgi:hypothetical protein
LEKQAALQAQVAETKLNIAEIKDNFEAQKKP